MYMLVFDFCALIIGFLILGSSTIRKQYKGRSNLILYCALIIVFLATVGDFTNALLANYGAHTKINQILMYIANYMYFFFHNLIMFGYVLYIYSSIDMWHIFMQRKKLCVLWVVLLVVDTLPLLMNITPLKSFSIDENLNYHREPLLYVFYIVALIMIVWSLRILSKNRMLVQLDRALVSVIMIIVAAAGIVIQFIYPRVLLEMFSITIASLFLLLVVRRDENQVDPITGAIKYNEGINRLVKDIELQKPIVIIFVKIKNYSNLRLYLGQSTYNSFLKLCTEKFYEIARLTNNLTEIYYMGNGLFGYLIEGNNVPKAYEAAKKTDEYFSEEIEVDGFKIIPDMRICLVSAPQDVKEFSVLYTLATTFHHTMPEDSKVHIYSDYKQNKDFQIRNEIKDILERGIRNKSFKMYYQPIYSIMEKRYISAEALIRLNDVVYGNISPGIFIPMAELEGSIHEIGEFVLEEVIRFISENNIEKMGLQYIEMNLSASQCIEVELVDKIKGLLEKYNVRPDQISLELTENAADINPAIVDQNIKKLHDFGIRIALDDYGTGYSNIKRVTSLPIDQIKLDKSFVDMIDDSQMWILLQDTITMLKEMKKEILVEGVEKESVAKKFTELDTDLFLGCELIQGFYFCKPLPEDKFVEFIKQHR